MKALLVLLALAELDVTLSETAYFCEDGYTSLQNNPDCYRAITSPLYIYDDARKYCQAEGGDLASIHNIFEDSLIKGFGQNGLLLGLRYYESYDVYKWSDGTPLDYKNYKDGFEENKDYDGYCTAYRSGKWDNADCDTDHLMFVCKRPATSYTVTPNNVCPNSSIYYLDEGPLYSPGYPNYFAAGLSCTYNLVAKNGYVIKLYPSGFQTSCDNWIDISGMFDPDDRRPSFEICNVDDDGYEITLPTNRIRIDIRSRSSAGKFKLEWEALKKDPIRSPVSYVENVITSNANEYFQCSSDYTLYGNTCYRFVTDVQLYYQDALQYCRNEGSDLASIHNSLVATFVQSLIGNVGDAFIGLSYDDSHGYQWSDGSSLDYTDYAEEFVSLREYLGYCAVTRNGKWHSRECNDRLNFVCANKPTNFTFTVANVCPPAETVYKDGGSLFSPGYPQTYSKISCDYVVMAKKNHFIKLVIKEADFHYATGDYILLYYWSNGQWTRSAFSTLCCAMPGTEAIIPHNHILLQFYGPTSGRWRINWEEIAKP